MSQTNLSIVEFYQRLAYKYRNWLSEFNKYDVVIPTELININGNYEDVPISMKSGMSLGFIKIINNEASYLNTFVEPNQLVDIQPITNYPCVFDFAEGLLARQVIETLPFSLSGNFSYSSNDYWIQNSQTKVHYKNWRYELNKVIDTNVYDTWLWFYVPGWYEYPHFLDINTDSINTKTIIQYPPKALIFPKTSKKTIDYRPTDRYNRMGEYTTAYRYLGEFYVEHYWQERWDWVDDSNDPPARWVYYGITTKDVWNSYWFLGNFRQEGSLTPKVGKYGTNQPIQDRRINSLLDIDAVAQP